MPGDGVFLIQGDELVVLKKLPYESESLLQQALASFPEVLTGGAAGDAEPTRLMLVRREMGIPGSEGAGARWSVDHLFVDAEGVPVVVEVKRSSDTRIRREVVGQMLDYAANAVRYWPIQELRDAFEATAVENGTTGDELLLQVVPNLPSDEFWRRVEGNLAAGRIRMVFVADELPPELIRIIEFLNEQMSPAEVLGVAVPQFVGGDQKLLVPELVGRTSTAVAAKTRTGRVWDEPTFLSSAKSTSGEGTAAFFEQLFEHVRRHGTRLNWGRGASPGVSGWYRLGGEPTPVWVANTGGGSGRPRLDLWLHQIAERMPSDQLEQFIDRLEEIPLLKTKITDARAADFKRRYPSFPVRELIKQPDQVQQLFAAFDLVVAE